MININDQIDACDFDILVQTKDGEVGVAYCDDKEIAHRLAKCWNAFRGMPDDNLIFNMNLSVMDQLQVSWNKSEELENLAMLLPCAYYLDPPDGGSVTMLEQFKRMAKDAERYRWLRDHHVGDTPELIQLTSVVPLGMDAAIDTAMALAMGKELMGGK